jgi:hypothetical protein
MNPLPILLRSILFMDLHAQRRVPDRCMGDFDRLTDRRAYDRAGAKTRTSAEGHASAGYQVRFLRHSSGVRWGKKEPPKDCSFRGPMHHRRTVGLDIPCQVARLQSLTPLLQARKV